MTAEAFVYRAFAKDDILLYVGVTNNFGMRFAQHNLQSEWWPEMCTMHITGYPARVCADLAERVAIVSERPKFNKLRYKAVQGQCAHRLITIRVSEEERARWNAFAAARGESLGAIIRRLVEREIAVKQVEAATERA